MQGTRLGASKMIVSSSLRTAVLAIGAFALPIHSNAQTESSPQPAPSSQTAPPIPSSPAGETVPIAIVATQGIKLTGAMEIPDGKAAIETNGSITGGDHAVTVTLPHRGFLKVCPTTKVNLATDATVSKNLPENESPGLLMALDRGAFEGYFATRQNSDVIMTPDYRVVISGPGLAAIQVRLGAGGDMCVGNGGDNAPYVSVSSIFNGGIYRVKANQRVTFQHGSLNEVVDREKESCGCPPEAPLSATGNDFPTAQSAGLAPLTPLPPNALNKGVESAQATVQLGYDGTKPNGGQPAATVTTPPLAAPPPAALKPPEPPGFFHKIGRFFRHLFGG